MSNSGFQRDGAVFGKGPVRLPRRVRGSVEIPDGPAAVLPSVERLECIAAAVRRWCADKGESRDRR